MKKIFILPFLLSFLFFFFLFPANSSAATLEVGAGRTYSTIQAAVNVSQAGDTVLVYPGTYNESVLIPDGKQGTATSPIIIKAQYPARKPLDGGAWADTTDKRSVVNAGSGVAAFYNNGPASRPPVQNLIIDGFYITGGGAPIQNYSNGDSCTSSCPGGGIMFLYDNNIWIRNNVIINDNPYLLYDTNGEQRFNVYLIYTGNSLVQNNYFVHATSYNYTTNAFFFSTGGSEAANNILEYNEFHIYPNSLYASLAYVRLRTTGFIFRYNYYHRDPGAMWAYTMLSRFRDHTGTTIANNYFMSEDVLPYFIVHENTDAGLIENHVLNNNTFYANQGTNIDRSGQFALGFLDNTSVSNNIFYSNVMDTNSYGIGRAFSGTPNYSVTIDSNVYYNYPGLVQLTLGGFTETNTQNLNPNINAATGCAASVNNAIYGANLNVSNIPYRKCDGAFYSAEGKFGISVVVSDGGSVPDTTPPSAPTGLVVN